MTLTLEQVKEADIFAYKDARAEVRKCQVLQAKMRREQNVETACVWSFQQFIEVVNWCRKHGRALAPMPHPMSL
jgi:hypothetical protein